MMENRPEYFAIWLGLIQAGAVVALISPELRAPAAAHALKVAGARRIIASDGCAEVCLKAVEALMTGSKFGSTGTRGQMPAN